MTTATNVQFKNSSGAWCSLLDLTWPVGSVYLAYNNAHAANRFGGSWTQLSGDRYVRLATNTTAAGSSTLSLTWNNIPAYSHMFPYPVGWSARGGGSASFLT